MIPGLGLILDKERIMAQIKKIVKAIAKKAFKSVPWDLNARKASFVGLVALALNLILGFSLGVNPKFIGLGIYSACLIPFIFLLEWPVIPFAKYFLFLSNYYIRAGIYVCFDIPLWAVTPIFWPAGLFWAFCPLFYIFAGYSERAGPKSLAELVAFKARLKKGKTSVVEVTEKKTTVTSQEKSAQQHTKLEDEPEEEAVIPPPPMPGRARSSTDPFWTSSDATRNFATAEKDAGRLSNKAGVRWLPPLPDVEMQEIPIAPVPAPATIAPEAASAPGPSPATATPAATPLSAPAPAPASAPVPVATATPAAATAPAAAATGLASTGAPGTPEASRPVVRQATVPLLEPPPPVSRASVALAPGPQSPTRPSVHVPPPLPADALLS